MEETSDVRIADTPQPAEANTREPAATSAASESDIHQNNRQEKASAASPPVPPIREDDESVLPTPTGNQLEAERKARRWQRQKMCKWTVTFHRGGVAFRIARRPCLLPGQISMDD